MSVQRLLTNAIVQQLRRIISLCSTAIMISFLCGYQNCGQDLRKHTGEQATISTVGFSGRNGAVEGQGWYVSQQVRPYSFLGLTRYNKHQLLSREKIN